ncbi:MAG TPA: NADH-quinone oxidoreductase subunit M [Marmoricola sp.]
MALTLTLVVPAVVAVWLLAAGRRYAPRTARGLALIASVVTFLLTLVTVVLRTEVDAPWVTSLGLRWHFAVDGVTIPLALLTAALGVAVVVHARGREPGRPGGAIGPSGGNSAATYYACLLLVEFGALATFFARDAILFFVAFEVVLVPMWVLISRFGDDHATERARADASNRFVLFTALGSTLMLLGILVLVVQSGTSDLGLLAAAHGAGLSAPTQVLVATLLVVGLGIKVPLWPVHTWLPPAHTIAPTAGSVLLAAVLLKMGTYGIIRLAIPTVPEGFHVVAPFLAASGAIGILWGGLACLVERDLKRLVAYSSVAHMGFVALGLASGTQTGMQAALFGNVAHGLVSALLFFVVGGLKERWGSADLTVARDALRDVSPRMGFALVVGFASALGLPGLVGFWGEFLAVYAAWTPAEGLPVPLFRICAVAGVVGMSLAAAYSLRVLRLVWAGHQNWTGPVGPAPRRSRRDDAHGAELLVVLALVALVIGLGVVPKPLLGATETDVTVLVPRSSPVGPASSASGGTTVEASGP